MPELMLFDNLLSCYLALAPYEFIQRVQYVIQ